VEDVYTLTDKIDLLGGISYDAKEGAYAYDKNSAKQEIYPGDLDSWNPQAAVLYKLDDASVVRASVSRKTYLTSMKDRYSRRLGFAEPNPDLQSEKATSYELSYNKTVESMSYGITGFITQVDDAIENVVQPSGLFQNQNVGEFQHTGIELDASYKGDSYEVGGNYTYLTIDNKSGTTAQITGVPENQLFAYAKKDIWTNTYAYANAKFRNGAVQQLMDTSYEEIPSFTTFDAKINYAYSDALSGELGIRNISDEEFAYDMGYPMPGREFFVTLEYKF
jgi:iron complex outermembrane receptor protein